MWRFCEVLEYKLSGAKIFPNGIEPTRQAERLINMIYTPKRELDTATIDELIEEYVFDNFTYVEVIEHLLRWFPTRQIIHCLEDLLNDNDLFDDFKEQYDL